MSRSHTGRFGALLAAILAGCVVSPRPEPPQASLDLDRVNNTWVFGAPITGDPGAASPAGATVRAFNLDAETLPAEGLVEEDGSFEVVLDFAPGDELRLVVVADEGRSVPIDALVGPDGLSLGRAERALGHCLTLEPAAELDLAEGGSVRIGNQCGQEVVLAQPALRRPLPDIEVGADLEWPLTLAHGDAAAVSVETGPGFATEDVVFIEASAPERDRRPITVVPPP